MRSSLPYRALIILSIVAGLAAAQAGEARKDARPKEVTLTGRVVDVHNVLIGQYKSENKVECTRESFKAGVAPALQVEDKLILLGHGTKSPQRVLAAMAFEMVEVHGKIYERGGISYLDMSRPPQRVALPEEPRRSHDDEEDSESEEGVDESDEDDGDPEPQPVSGACCLGGGECDQMTSEECADENGDFHEDLTCDDVEC